MGQKLKDGPPLALDHLILYQMLGDPSFYSRVPVFYFLKEQGLAVTDGIRQRLLDNNPSTGCPGCANVRGLMAPLVDTFVTHLKKLAVDAPAALEAMAVYVAERRGFRPRPILVYYRDKDGGLAAVQL